MARYSVSVRTTNAGTAARPQASLYAIASISGSIVEIGVTNSTAIATGVTINRLTATGTQGTPLTETKYNDRSPAASMTGFNSHSADATVTDEIARASINGSIGAGFVFTFGGGGLLIPAGTTNGIGILPLGTGQVLDVYIVWDE